MNDLNIEKQEIKETNGSKYQTFIVSFGKTKYSVTLWFGRYNMINVIKLNQPFFSLGKDFSSFDDAVSAYKNANLKCALLQIETILK